MFDNPVGIGIIVVVVLLLFAGPKRLPQLSRAVGESIKEFKGGINHDDDKKQELGSAPSRVTETSDEHSTVSK